MGIRSLIPLKLTLFRRGVDSSQSADLFAETRMPFGDHLDELRRRLIRAFAGLAIALASVFAADAIGYFTGTAVGIGKPVMELITHPVERELQRFYDRRVEKVAREIGERRAGAGSINAPKEVLQELEINSLLKEIAPRLGIPVPTRPSSENELCYIRVRVRINPVDWAIALSAAQRLVGPRPSLQTMSITEAMTVYLQVALACGLVLASPWVFWQLWTFVAVALHPHEKRPVRVYLPFSLALFLAGAATCQLLVVPQAIEALLWFNEWLDFEPTLRLSEWLGFAIFMPVLFGIAFQTPLVMLCLHRLGLVSVAAYRRQRRVAWLLIAVFTAVATPTNDALSMLYLLGPMCFLYELGILLCRLAPSRRVLTKADESGMGLIEPG